MSAEARLSELGLILPAPMRLPDGIRVMWRQTRVIGSRVVIAGHGPRHADGASTGLGGKVGSDLTLEQGYAAARSTGLAVLSDLKAEIGDLDRVLMWVRVFGIVNAAPGFVALPPVIDGFTDLMVSVFGEESGLCPRAVIGAAELPFGSPVIIEGEVALR
jgi:YjgF/chorismate_mutase-like, putative endoribonuclease